MAASMASACIWAVLKDQWGVDYDDDFWLDGVYGPGVGAIF